jgi:hypothetical protein
MMQQSLWVLGGLAVAAAIAATAVVAVRARADR